MAARDFRFRVVRVEVNVGEDAAVCIPTPDVGFVLVDGEFFTGGTTAIDDERGVRAVCAAPGTRPGAAEQGEAVASPPRAASLGAFGSSSGSHESRGGAASAAGNVSAQQSSAGVGGGGGGPHAKLVIHRGRSVGKEFPMSEDETQIGRWDADGGIFPDVDLDADDPEAKVSRRHARITRRGEQYFVEDLGSTNGTFINRGRRLLPGDRHPLRDGDEVIVGKTFLRFQVLK